MNGKDGRRCPPVFLDGGFKMQYSREQLARAEAICNAIASLRTEDQKTVISFLERILDAIDQKRGVV